MGRQGREERRNKGEDNGEKGESRLHDHFYKSAPMA